MSPSRILFALSRRYLTSVRMRSANDRAVDVSKNIAIFVLVMRLWRSKSGGRSVANAANRILVTFRRRLMGFCFCVVDSF